MSQMLSWLRRHPLLTGAASVVVLLGGVAVANRDLIDLALSRDESITAELPVAAPVQPRAGEVVYSIDPTASRATVLVDEELAGASRQVELTTSGIAGQVALGEGPDGRVTARIGEILVDVARLRSDNSLRDKMLRHEYLESHRHPQVRMSDAEVAIGEHKGFTNPMSVGDASVVGTLDVKGVGHPITFDVEADLDGDELRVDAVASVTLSELGVGPIVKAGLVRTSDEARIVLDLVARARSAGPVSSTLPDVDEADEAVSTGPSFSTEVQPILEANCASCHAPGEIGSTMWELADAGDAAEVADGLGVVTTARYMPPWPASTAGVDLRHVRSLDDRDIDTIARWARSGGALDVDPSTPVEPTRPARGAELRADRRVSMKEPYQVTPSNTDDYRCFVLDPEVTEPSLLTGYTFDPDQLQVVHHAIVNRVRSEDVRSTIATDLRDEGPGWSCLAGMGFGLGDRVAGWVPGQDVVRFDEDEGFDLFPGDVLVAQIHYHYAPDVAADRSGMTLQLDPLVEKSVRLESRTLIGPVELPCPSGTSGALCERSAALADVANRFGPVAPSIANGLHTSCGTTPEQVAATFDGQRGSTTCDFYVAQGGDLIGMLAHMHEIGSSYRMTLNPGSAGETVLLDIPTWNFAWQLGYAPVDTIRLTSGDVPRVTCTFDRRLRHETQPAWIVFAEGTTDEMCYTSLTVRPEY